MPKRIIGVSAGVFGRFGKDGNSYIPRDSQDGDAFGVRGRVA